MGFDVCDKLTQTQSSHSSSHLARLPIMSTATPEQVSQMYSRLWEDPEFLDQIPQNMRAMGPPIVVVSPKREPPPIPARVLIKKEEMLSIAQQEAVLVQQIARLQAELDNLRAAKGIQEDAENNPYIS